MEKNYWYYEGYQMAVNEMNAGKEIYFRTVSQCITPEFCQGWNDAIKFFKKYLTFYR